MPVSGTVYFGLYILVDSYIEKLSMELFRTKHLHYIRVGRAFVLLPFVLTNEIQHRLNGKCVALSLCSIYSNSEVIKTCQFIHIFTNITLTTTIKNI